MAKYSLHIGVNYVNTDCYGDDYHLHCCENDAEALGQIALSQNFKTVYLLSENATYTRLNAMLEYYQSFLVKDDLLFISFSGHGQQIPDENGDEPDGLDELWCLYDARVSDDYFFRMLKGFREDVKILVVADCCHSGTSLRSLTPIISNSSTRHMRSQSLQQLKEEPLASIIFLGGCESDQYSKAGIGNSMFTNALMEVWEGGKFQGNYEDFFLAIHAKVHLEQSPVFEVLGKKCDAFLQSSPFST